MRMDEHRIRMISEQRRRDAESGVRNYQNRYRHEEEAEELELEKQGQHQKKAPPKKKRGRWWRFFIGE